MRYNIFSIMQRDELAALLAQFRNSALRRKRQAVIRFRAGRSSDLASESADSTLTGLAMKPAQQRAQRLCRLVVPTERKVCFGSTTLLELHTQALLPSCFVNATLISCAASSAGPCTDSPSNAFKNLPAYPLKSGLLPAGWSQSAMLASAAFEDILSVHICSKLQPTGLQSLSQTCRALHKLVHEQLPDSTWSAVAVSSLPTAHPLLSVPGSDVRHCLERIAHFKRVLPDPKSVGASSSAFSRAAVVQGVVVLHPLFIVSAGSDSRVSARLSRLSSLLDDSSWSQIVAAL